MENIECSQKSVEDLQKSNNTPPWIELLDSLIEEIIEKLPLVDYIRFGSICKQWHSIQKEHRLRYSPKPPPIAPSVVLLNFRHCWSGLDWKNDKQLLCHLPFGQKKYFLSLPFLSLVNIIHSCCGWILTFHEPNRSFLYFNIYNPLTGVIVQLPPLQCQSYDVCTPNGSMSAPPTDPNCCIVIATSDDIFMLRLRDLVWVKVQVTHDLDFEDFSQFFYVNSKFYRISKFAQIYNLCIIDPFLRNPIEHNLEVDIEEMKGYDYYGRTYFSIDVELFMVMRVSDEHIMERFAVFKANFTIKKWIRVTSLGDHAILLSNNGPYGDYAVSLSVSSVDGFKKNMIYFSQKFKIEDGDHEGIMRFRVAWMTFDMDSQEVAEGPSFLYEKDNDPYSLMLFWFFPTL